MIKYCKISELCKIYSGNSINEKIKKEKYTNNNGIEYISTKDIGYNLKINYNNGIKISNSDLEKFRIAPPQTVFICAEGGSAGRKLAISDRQLCFVNKLFAIVSTEKVLPKFIFYFIQSDNFNKQFKSAITGLIGGVSLNKFKEFEIPILPILTQQKIVAKLDKIFAEIDKVTAAAEANAKNAEALFHSYLKRIFDCDDEGWKEVTIGSLYKVTSSKRVLKSDWKSEGVPFYRGREITSLSKFGYVENDLFITEKMYSEYSLTYGVPSADDIMVTAIGTIGNTYIVKNNDKFYFKDASVLWLKKEKDIDSKFVNYWFKSSHFTSQLDVGLGATVDSLTIGKVGGLRIKIPTLNTQKHVVEKLDALSSEIIKSTKSYKDKADELASLRQSTLKQAFSGELVKAA